VDSVPRAEWLLADACEIASLDEASLERCNVVIAATGDDKGQPGSSRCWPRPSTGAPGGRPHQPPQHRVAVQRVLGRGRWRCPTPRIMSALVEEAVSVGDLVRLMTFRQSDASLVELTMPSDAPLVGQRIGTSAGPPTPRWVAILRDGRVLVPAKDDPTGDGDELLFVTSEDVEDELATLLSGGPTITTTLYSPGGDPPEPPPIAGDYPRFGDLRATVERVERLA